MMNMLRGIPFARLKESSLTTEGKRVAGLLVLAALTRIVLSSVLRVAPDLQAYEIWGQLILNHFFHPYSYSIATSNVWLYPTYPPLTMYIYAIIDFLYFGAVHVLGLHASQCACSSVLRPILLAPSILSDLALVAIIYVLARTKTSPNGALLLSALYAFSPPVLLDTVAWGQTDSLALLIAVGALLLALRHNGLWAGVLLGLAIVLKYQPCIFIPVVLVYLYRWAGMRQALRGTAAMIGTAVILWAPYLLPPKPEIFAWERAALINTVASGVVASRNAHNLWWLLHAQRVGINSPYIGPLSPQILGGAIFVAVLVLALAGIWRDASPGRLWAAAGLVAIGFFDVVTLGYERYIFYTMGLFLLAWLYDRRYWVLFVAVSVSAFVSLGQTVFTEGDGLAASLAIVHTVGGFFGLGAVTRIAAAVNVGILLLASWMFCRPLTAPHEVVVQHAETQGVSAVASS